MLFNNVPVTVSVSTSASVYVGLYVTSVVQYADMTLHMCLLSASASVGLYKSLYVRAMFRFQCVITVMSNVDHDNAHLGGPCRSVEIQSRQTLFRLL